MHNLARHSFRLLLALAPLSSAPFAHAAQPTVAECLGANEQSIALRRESKLKAAREQLLICAAASCPAEVRKECAERVEKVNAAIPTIVFEVRDAKRNDVLGVRVSVDGQAATDQREGVALPLDPGTHTFNFEANGFAPVEKSFVLRQGEKDRREFVTLNRAPLNELTKAPDIAVPPASAGVAEHQTSAPPPVATSASQSESASRAQRLRTVAFIVGGVGVASLGIGSAFGILAKRSYDASNEDNHCGASGCDDKGLQKRDDAFKQARISTAFFIGGAAISAGAVGLFLISRSQREQPSVSRISVIPIVASSGGGVALSGGF